jgi:hypothetical protein
MLEELYMRDLADAMKMPAEPLPASKVTVSAPEPEMAGMDKAFVGTRLNVPKPGQPTQQDREKMAIGLLDTLAGALRGAAAQVGGLPGDIRSILDMINQEGAEKYLGQRSFATTEEILKDTSVRVPGTKIDVPFPPVLKEGVPNRAERQKAVEVAQEVGTFLPAPGIPEAAIQGVKAVGKAIKATKNMPVGMSTQAVGQGMDELGFYSAAKQAVDAIQQPKGTGAQFLAQISKTPGVKPDEIKWTGLDEFLQSKKSVTKAEVQEYLDKNRVQIKEITLESKNPYPYRNANDWENAIRREERFGNFDEAERINAAWEDFELGSVDSTKFSKYTLPGGENYREVLLTLPQKSSAREALGGAPKELSASEAAKTIGMYEDDFTEGATVLYYPSGAYIEKLPNGAYYALIERSEKTSKNLEDVEKFIASSGLFNELPQNASKDYFGSHFDQPNILAHIRVNDRVIDGKKTLFVEEVQSDWHQAGRKKGYKNPNTEKQILDLEKQMSDMAEIRDPVTNQIVDEEKFSALWRKKDELLEQNKGVPDAPFKTTWSDLSMKRVIQMASEGGYDRIAFTTGKTQADRYDLSKQINELSYKKMDDELTMGLGNGPYYEIVAVDKSDMPVLRKQVTEQELPDLVGKDMAKKIIDGEGKVAEDYMGKSVTKVFSGLDLQVGGEGMKGFYDDILPKFLNKYAKKWDAKTGVTEIPTNNVNIENQITFEDGKYLVDAGDGINYNSYDTKAEAIKSLGGDNPQVNYIDVTPKMRESVVTKGQPMFAIGAGGAGAAATQEENK